MNFIKLYLRRIANVFSFLFRKRLKISTDIFDTKIHDFNYFVNENDVSNYNEVVENKYNKSTVGLNKGIHPLFFTKISWKIIENLNEYLEKPIDSKILKTIVHQSEYIRYFNSFDIPGNLTVKSNFWKVERHRKGTKILINFDYYSDDKLIASEYTGGLLFGVKCIGESRSFEEIPKVHINSGKILWTKQEKIDINLPYIYASKAEIDAPIHTNPGFAKSLGLPGILLQGTCTLAKSVNLIESESTTSNREEIASVSGKFTGFLVPPNNIFVRVFTDNKQMIIFDVLNDSGNVVIAGGQIKFKSK